METTFSIGDCVLVSPYLTHSPNWLEGKVIDVENNTFNGIVISAETEDGSIYFQRAEYFKKK